MWRIYFKGKKESPCPEEVWATREAAEQEGIPYWQTQAPGKELEVRHEHDPK